MKTRRSVIEQLARFGFQIFMIGLVIVLSLLLHVWLERTPPYLARASIDAWPHLYEPARPPMEVTVSRLRENGAVVVERKRKYQLIPDEGAVAQQQYWLGILNPGTVDRFFEHPGFSIEARNIKFIERQLPKDTSPVFWEKLDPWLAEHQYKQWRDGEFNEQLNRLIETKELTDAVRARILTVAAAIKEKTSHSQTLNVAATLGLAAPLQGISPLLAVTTQSTAPTDVRPTPFRLGIEDLRAAGIEKRDSNALESYLFHWWKLAELQDAVDKLFPGDWEEGYRRLVVQAALSAGVYVEVQRWMIFWRYLLGAGVCLGLLALANYRGDVNAFSLHGMYHNRLVRAYLGAVRKRHPNPITGFDPGDEVSFDKLLAHPSVGYDGPYPIFNVAMNLVKTRELAWLEREAISFVFCALLLRQRLDRFSTDRWRARGRLCRRCAAWHGSHAFGRCSQPEHWLPFISRRHFLTNGF